LELLNPYNEQIAMDDKLSILDIKARDDRGRLFNVEMQMVSSASLRRRLLYYWSKLYSQQLSEGDDYTKLCPTISICFVNDDLFAGRESYRSEFRLLEADGSLCLTDDLVIHVLEIPKFTGLLGDLKEPLDFWLYFLKNGDELDADALPDRLGDTDIRQAMGVLKMLAQNDMERELYEGRLKARRDLQTMETERRMALEKAEEYSRRFEEADRQRDEADRQRDEADRRAEEADRRAMESDRQRNEAQRAAGKLAMIERIQLCQRLSRQDMSQAEDLAGRDLEDLRLMAERLERDLSERR
jgi:predicted transposase/invertase (TIGR01784 family)